MNNTNIVSTPAEALRKLIVFWPFCICMHGYSYMDSGTLYKSFVHPILEYSYMAIYRTTDIIATFSIRDLDLLRTEVATKESNQAYSFMAYITWTTRSLDLPSLQYR